ncbi:hypothetical protein V5O48_009420 [Marasmius crinis-equi]|uniref:Carboxylic ester hydrolase n=1 Tax=Marasmius crinis-equi TaxID=585013 RepID=A0ABR3FB95_9AGAR
MKNLVLLLTPLAIAYAAQVQLGNTTLVGKDLVSQGLEFYGGIPFAEAPVGKLRLKPPVPKTSLDVATLNATDFGASCLQPRTQSPISEDCLFVNVLKPADVASDASLPVAVFIYGGANVVESPFHLNASAFVAKSVSRGTPIIYASFNYRLGPLGFPAGSEAAAKGALNVALKDQLAALEWIRDNIAAFGGDKDKITLLGWSGGAIFISLHYLNLQIEKYARAAILQSGAPTLVFDEGRSQGFWDDFIAGIPECASYAKNQSIDCLQNEQFNSTQLLGPMTAALGKSGQQFPWTGILDGRDGVIPDWPSEQYKQGHFSNIPLMFGNVLDEGSRFTWGIPDEKTVQDAIVANLTTHRAAEEEQLREAVDQLLTFYPDDAAAGSPFGTGNETFGLTPQAKQYAAIIGDIIFQSARRAFTKAVAGAGVKAFGYLYTFPERLGTVPPSMGVQHGAEVDYVFGLPTVNSTDGTKLSEQLMDYWLSFITTLDPNDGIGSERPVWPEYASGSETILQLNGPENSTVIPDDYRAEGIAFINGNPGLFSH